MNIASLEAIQDWIAANYYSDEEIVENFYIQYTLTIRGSANEVIAIKDQASGRTESLTLSGGGQGTINMKFLPGDVILVQGSINGIKRINVGLETSITIDLTK